MLQKSNIFLGHAEGSSSLWGVIQDSCGFCFKIFADAQGWTYINSVKIKEDLPVMIQSCVAMA